MTDPLNQFYECDNPQCRMRFPGTEGQPRWHRCPICRSNIHLVASVPQANRKNDAYHQKQSQPVEAILDNVRSAWNVGSIFRTADGTGISKLYLCGITPTPHNSRLAKTALGAEINLSWEKHNNTVLLSRELKSRGYLLWVLEDLPGAQALFQVETDAVNSPVILVVGNEVSGVDPGVLELCDKVIAIPMIGEKQSYNVAVAFGIAASFLLYRQIFSQGSRNILPRT
jgi:23S rRNA (guanosine2251-2'-O)-methyltransferase